MKHIKSICSLLLLAVILMTGNSSFAAKLPKMKDKYVTDAAGILSKSELNQLRTDVKAMCDYYSTRILVGIVPTFDGYDIEEYAGMLGEHWDLADENTMFILVKPKSDDERGEAMLVTSSDLKDVFSSEVCDEIVQNEMIPYFKKDDYFGGIEAALEYMNNMSDEEEETTDVATTTDEVKKSDSDSSFFSDAIKGLGIAAKKLGKGLFWLLGFALVAAVIAGIVIAIKNHKEDKEDNNENPPRPLIKSNSNEVSQAVEAKKEEVAKRKQELEELQRLDRESENIDREFEKREREYESHQYSPERRSEYRQQEREDDSNGELSDFFEKMKDLQNSNSSGKAGGIVGKVVKGAAVVGGAVVAGKVIKDIADKRKDDDDDEGLLDKMGGIFKKDKKSDKPSGKPKLGGSGKPKASGKPKLGGGGSKPKLGGGSSSGGW